ncbi:hypothetical protein ILFOPFJJ_06995 [Ensifer psoraleae]|nr:hypothetical protein [Sinorhizobium psoraleae]
MLHNHTRSSRILRARRNRKLLRHAGLPRPLPGLAEIGVQRGHAFIRLILMRPVARGNREIGSLKDRLALSDQLCDGRLWVGGLQQPAASPALVAPHYHVRIRLEPDRDCLVMNQGTGLIMDERIRTGREHRGTLFERTRDHLRLEVPEMLLAMGLTELPYRRAGFCPDRVIGIDEVQPQPLRKIPADGGFSGTRHADEHDGPIAESRHNFSNLTPPQLVSLRRKGCTGPPSTNRFYSPVGDVLGAVRDSHLLTDFSRTARQFFGVILVQSISAGLLLKLFQLLVGIVIDDLGLVTVWRVELRLEAVTSRSGEHGFDADKGRITHFEPVGCADLGIAPVNEAQHGFLEGGCKIAVRDFEEVSNSIAEQLSLVIRRDAHPSELGDHGAVRSQAAIEIGHVHFDARLRNCLGYPDCCCSDLWLFDFRAGSLNLGALRRLAEGQRDRHRRILSRRLSARGFG